MSNRNQPSLNNFLPPCFKPMINLNHNIYKVVLHASSAQVVSILFTFAVKRLRLLTAKQPNRSDVILRRVKNLKDKCFKMFIKACTRTRNNETAKPPKRNGVKACRKQTSVKANRKHVSFRCFGF